ncbi:pilus assembly protein TadG-related protein [Rubellimicrobium aerolatum]|uniref:Pilus assembly protein TadG-related protein n=1 Tax=Rubellimicrobium aerolatum TaxID=490979 RepID=A0ABW0S8P4_9RHOB|nr:pilus assembly protein TadG-related protein [Rubellimicrobium aerolatum]MBP1804656.1 hypothetical protein [Rubellimicrobium aerolatum]
MTVHAMFMLVAACILGAAAVDVSHLNALRSEMQVAADAAARGALLWRIDDGQGSAQAKLAAVRLVRRTQPRQPYGSVVGMRDIAFGRFDAATGAFRPERDSREAAWARAAREEAKGNPVATLLFRLIGVDAMDVAAEAVAVAWLPPCLDNGLVAEGPVALRTTRVRLVDLCLHSNDSVTVARGARMQGTGTLSVPRPEALVGAPPLLAERLRLDRFGLRVMAPLMAKGAGGVAAGMARPGSAFRPAHLDAAAEARLEPEREGGLAVVGPQGFRPGALSRYDCAAGERLALRAGTYAGVALLTDCALEIADGARLEDVRIVSTATGAEAVRIAGALALGRPDRCAEGGGAQVATRGGVVAEGLVTLEGGQILAAGDIDLAGGARGHGAAVTAGGSLTASTLVDLWGCATGQEGNLRAHYVRLAR